MKGLEKGYEFDDVLLVPRVSRVGTRKEVDISTEIIIPPILFGKERFSNTYTAFKLELPIIASPMKGIVGTELIFELGKMGGLGILHRFHSKEKGEPDLKSRLEDMHDLEKSGVPYGISIGIEKDYENIIISRLLRKEYKNCKVLLVDSANGYTTNNSSYITKLYKAICEQGVGCMLMAGNVVDGEGIRSLSTAGASLWRVGIGSGALCTTRNKTGVGMPQLTALSKVKKFCTEYHKSGYIISDGGIKNSGDIVKALAIGADFVMIGSLFATTKESENNGTIYGMASKELQENFYGSVKSIEGTSKEVERSITLEELINDISWSIKSACGYLNARNLLELRKNARFIEVGRNSIDNSR